MRARIKKALLPLGVLSLGGAAVVVLNVTKPLPEATSEAPRPLSVHTTPAERRASQLVVSTTGEVRATVESELVAQVAGRVTAVSPEFVEGGRFQNGETLVTIEDTDYRMALNEAKARVAAARVDVETALADADVAEKQLAGVANPSPLALKKPQVSRAQLALEAAEAGLALAETNLQRTRIALPYTGRLLRTGVDIGEYVGPGSVLATAFGTDRVEIRLPLTDEQLGALGVPIGYVAPALDEGLPVTLTAVVAGEYHRWSGRVERLDAAIDPETRVIYATAVVEDPYTDTATTGGMPLAVGLFVEASISGRIVENAIRIPSDGLRAGDRVFVLADGGVLDIREVDVIHSNAAETILGSGVLSGEEIITSAIRNPIPGMALERIGTEVAVGGSGETLAN